MHRTLTNLKYPKEGEEGWVWLAGGVCRETAGEENRYENTHEYDSEPI